MVRRHRRTNRLPLSQMGAHIRERRYAFLAIDKAEQQLDEALDDYHRRIDLLSVMARFTRFRKKGRHTLMAKCPFHIGRRYSIFTYPGAQKWYCDTCKLGGNVVRFLALAKQITLRQALRELGVRHRGKLVTQYP